MTKYRHADREVQVAAAALIVKHHPHLQGIRVDIVFRDTATVQVNKVVLGKARKISGLNAFLADAESQTFFVIELADDAWAELSEAGQMALLDHELAHCKIRVDDTGNVIPYLQPHDIEEFAEIVARHGLWKNDLREFGLTVGDALQVASAPAEPLRLL